VVAAVESDKAKAMGEFTRGENGFRTVDTYVFCVGANGVMTAHPNPILQGQDVHDLHDETGNYFIATMLKNAKPGSPPISFSQSNRRKEILPILA